MLIADVVAPSRVRAVTMMTVDVVDDDDDDSITPTFVWHTVTTVGEHGLLFPELGGHNGMETGEKPKES